MVVDRDLVVVRKVVVMGTRPKRAFGAKASLSPAERSNTTERTEDLVLKSGMMIFDILMCCCSRFCEIKVLDDVLILGCSGEEPVSYEMIFALFGARAPIKT